MIYLDTTYKYFESIDLTYYNYSDYYDIFDEYFRQLKYKDAFECIKFMCENHMTNYNLITICTYDEGHSSLIDLSIKWSFIELIDYASNVVPFISPTDVFRDMIEDGEFSDEDLLKFISNYNIIFTEEIIINLLINNMNIFDTIVNKFNVDTNQITEALKSYLSWVIRKIDINRLNSLNDKYKFMPNQINLCLAALEQQFDIEKLKWIYSKVNPRIKISLTSDILNQPIINKLFEIFKWFIDKFDISITLTTMSLIYNRDLDEYLFYIINHYKYTKQDIINRSILKRSVKLPKIYNRLIKHFHFTLEEIEGVS
jgi:hypothetical protein